MLLRGIVSSTVFTALSFIAQGAELTLKTGKAAAPADVSPAIAAMLQDEAIQLQDAGANAIEIWPVKEVALKAKPESAAKALDALTETAILGVVQIHKDMRDFRDDELPAGVYTMRFGIQPEDGDHLGTSPTPYFVVLIPAAHDKDPAGVADHDTLAESSQEHSNADHPANFNLRPVAKLESEAPKLDSDSQDDAKTVVLEIPATAAGEKTTLLFALVYEGMGKI